MRTDSLAFRLVAGAALWVVVALAACGVLLSHLFAQSVERGFDTRLQVFLDDLIAESRAGEGGKVEVAHALGEPRFNEPYSGWYWQVSGPDGAMQRSRSLWDMTLDMRPGKVGEEDEPNDLENFGIDGPDGRKLRVVARDVTLPDLSSRLNFAVAAEDSEISREVAHFDQALAYSLTALGLGLISAVVIQVYFGLLPLRRLRVALAAIRTGRAKRLEGRFAAELQPLAEELNALLTHDAAVVECARTHVGNLAHALKTPLAVLGNEAAVAQGPLAQQVARQTAVMLRQVDHYLARARAAATGGLLGARTAVLPVTEDLKRTLERIHVERRILIEVAGDSAAAFRGEREDLEEMLGNLMDNGCKWARSKLAVAVERADGRVVIVIEDDGAGLTPEEREQVFERGRRLDEAMPGSGLGLSIVRDIAELYGGSVTLDAGANGGLKVTLVLPAATAEATKP
jgi:signal transduction histidine kinase